MHSNYCATVTARSRSIKKKTKTNRCTLLLRQTMYMRSECTDGTAINRAKMRTNAGQPHGNVPTDGRRDGRTMQGIVMRTHARQTDHTAYGIMVDADRCRAGSGNMYFKCIKPITVRAPPFVFLLVYDSLPLAVFPLPIKGHMPR